MYTVINNETQFVTIFFEMSALGRFLGVDRSTVFRRFDKSNPFIQDRYTVYKADEVIKKTRKTGNRDDKATRERKQREKNE